MAKIELHSALAAKRALREHRYAEQIEALGPLLDTIAEAEHSRPDPERYNTAMGNIDAPFTTMTINEVLDWQRDNNPPGLATAAAGRYQIIRNTLLDLKEMMGLRGDELFDKNMQDAMAIRLLKKRGLDSYMAGDISRETFMYRISMEWASLPKNMEGISYYGGDGINAAHASPHTVLAAIDGIKDNSLKPGTPVYASTDIQVAYADTGGNAEEPTQVKPHGQLTKEETSQMLAQIREQLQERTPPPRPVPNNPTQDEGLILLTNGFTEANGSTPSRAEQFLEAVKPFQAQFDYGGDLTTKEGLSENALALAKDIKHELSDNAFIQSMGRYEIASYVIAAAEMKNGSNLSDSFGFKDIDTKDLEQLASQKYRYTYYEEVMQPYDFSFDFGHDLNTFEGLWQSGLDLAKEIKATLRDTPEILALTDEELASHMIAAALVKTGDNLNQRFNLNGIGDTELHGLSSAILNTKELFRGLDGIHNISFDYYEDLETPEGQKANAIALAKHIKAEFDDPFIQELDTEQLAAFCLSAAKAQNDGDISQVFQINPNLNFQKVLEETINTYVDWKTQDTKHEPVQPKFGLGEKRPPSRSTLNP